MEKTITISFDEYQNVIKENEFLHNAFKQKKDYVLESSCYWFDTHYVIYSDNEALDLLTKRCNKLNKISYHLLNSIKDLKKVNYFNINRNIEKILEESKIIANE